jgi:SecD/SecF fusion protein
MILSQGVTLGLDIRGGSSFVVQIEADKLREKLMEDDPGLKEGSVELEANLRKKVKEAQNQATEVLRGRLDALGIAEPNIYAEGDDRIAIQIPGATKEQREAAARSIEKVGYLSFNLVHEDNEDLVQDLWSQPPPAGFIVDDFHLEGGRTITRYARIPKATTVATAQQIIDDFPAPPRCMLMLSKRRIDGGRTGYEPIFVYKREQMNGDDLKSARYSRGPMGEHIVNLEFDSRGAKSFKKLTSDYVAGGRKNPTKVGRRLAILLDDTIYSAPVIESVIPSGEAIIRGIDGAEEANRLVIVLNAGNLPAPVKIVQRHVVDASLGKDLMKRGVTAIIVGASLVLIFMLMYYGISGVIANLALLLDLIMLPFGMVVAAGFLGTCVGEGLTTGSFNLPTLTLPGIAGILLTIGIAVDANVLIFERIREEFKVGKTIRSAISAGYDRAFFTIVDANVTTLITAVILFIFGSGSVRGFAVTLSGGILISMFTALVVTRLMFDTLVDKTSITKLRMMSFISDTKFDFIGKRGLAAVLSIIVIAGTWVMLVTTYNKDVGRVFDVDFTGGTAVTMTVEKMDSNPTVGDVRETLSEAGVDSPHIQYKWPVGGVGLGELLIRSGEIKDKEVGSLIKDSLILAYGDVGLAEGDEREVGSQIGRELRKSAVYAIALALLGIVLYITWRFEFGFAVGAIAALTHDVLITVGLFVLFGRQMSLPIVAALLTIVGYSVNDTIVVFDRIREDLKDSSLRRKYSYKEICNISINQTLSRTILTSLTTLLAVGALLMLGGGSIADFALALCIGVVVGTYSSIFVATPVMLLWHRGSAPVVKSK